MKSIRKLNIIFKIAMFFAFILFFLPMFKKNLGIGALVSIVLIFLLFKFIIFKKKREDYKKVYTRKNLFIYLMLGTIFLFFAVIFSFVIISNSIKGNPQPFWSLFMTLGFWIFGILLICYPYKIWKEFHSK